MLFALAYVFHVCYLSDDVEKFALPGRINHGSCVSAKKHFGTFPRVYESTPQPPAVDGNGE